MSPKLVHIPISPWSWRVRLALRMQGIDIDQVLYTPLMSEVWLRWMLRRPRGRFTLPVLLRDDGPPLENGIDIVRWADERAPRSIVGDEEAVRHWSARADALMEAGRLRSTARVLEDEQALRDSLPPPIHRWGPLGLWLGRDAARRLAAKYDDGRDDTARLETMEAVLVELAEALDGGEHVLDGESYADVCMACALEFVSPWSRSGHRPSARRAWTEPELAGRYPALLAWRDQVLARF